MSTLRPRHVCASIERAIAFAGEASAPLPPEEAAALRADGHFRPLVRLPWLEALYARQDAEWALEAALEEEEALRARAGVPPRFESDGVDVDAGETRCPHCRGLVRVRVGRSGLALACDRDGRPHGHDADAAQRRPRGARTARSRRSDV